MAWILATPSKVETVSVAAKNTTLLCHLNPNGVREFLATRYCCSCRRHKNKEKEF
jgi:hypothetical protein